MRRVEGFRPDEMTAEERMTALIEGKPIDRVPFMFFGGLGFCGRNVGYSFADMYSDPEKSADAQIWTMEQYGTYCEPTLGYASYGAWEFGGEVRFPTGEWEQAPKIIRHPVNSEEDALNLELPDVTTAGMLPRIMKFCKIMEQRGLPINFSCGTPFTRAGNICGVERMCRWIIKKPQLVHHVLRLATEHLVQVMRYFVDTFGADRIRPRDGLPTEANQVISPKQYQEFALPYTIELHERVLAMGVKRWGNIHICGEQNLNLPYWEKVPLGERSLTSFGHEVDIDTAIKYLGDRCIIAGNINTSALQAGTPQQVYELCRQAIEKGKRAPNGFVLMPGCEVPAMAPPINIYMMRKAINDCGWYV